MTAIFIGIILNELDMLHGWMLFWYIVYCVWRFIKLFDQKG